MTHLPLALLLFRPSNYLEEQLRLRVAIVPWFGLTAAERSAWLGSDEAQRVTVILTNGKTGCPAELIQILSQLKMIAIHGVGFDCLDLSTAEDANIVVTYTPGVLTDDVADLAVGLIIGLLREIVPAQEFVRQERWSGADYRLATKVSGKRFGIVGLGRIGEAIAHRLSVFGPVSCTSRSAKAAPWTFFPDVVSLARWSDVLIVACSANEQTRSLVDAEVLAALGDTGFLVNVARGSVIDEAALVEALRSRKLAGAALDVFAGEPHVNAGLRESKRTLLTPHIGSATTETRRAMVDMVLASLDAFLAGEPVPNQVPRINGPASGVPRRR